MVDPQNIEGCLERVYQMDIDIKMQMLLHCRYLFITKKAGRYNMSGEGLRELSAAKRLGPTTPH